MPDVVMKSDDTLITLNRNIETALKKYLPADNGPAVRFDMADKDNLPDTPTICVFLYDIQEDLELRHGRSRQYDASAGAFAPRQVHMRCCYLLTYWEKTADGGKVGPDAQPVQMMNKALNALLNMQFADDFPAVLRVVAPSEHLSSLGNFWQSLGDKPRLCLNFNVTVPVRLGLKADDSKETGPMVRNIILDEQPEVPEPAVQTFRRALLEKVIARAATRHPDADLNALRGQLSKLQLNGGVTNSDPYKLEGLVDKDCGEMITAVFAGVLTQTGMKVENSLMILDGVKP